VPVASIAFVRDDTLWVGAASGNGEPAAVARLELEGASLRDLQSSCDGQVFLLNLDRGVLWVRRSTSGRATPVRLDCRGPGHLSSDGDHVLCPGPVGTVNLHELAPRRRVVQRKIEGTTVGFLGPIHRAQVTVEENQIWGISTLRTPGKRKRLASHAPDAGLLVAPDGKRAAGTYHEDGAPVLYQFRLDGTASRRQLLSGGRPVAWSRDGKWLAVQTDERACAVRAAGGQYTCWPEHRALALSDAGDAILLTRPHEGSDGDDGPRRSARCDLYVARTGGVRLAAPTRVWRNTHCRAALWLPSGASALPDAPAPELDEEEPEPEPGETDEPIRE
jgi:hypothetical protein